MKTFLKKDFETPDGERKFTLLGRAWLDDNGGTIEYAVQDSEREIVRITVPISRIDLDSIEVITIVLVAPYGKCLAQKLWNYSIGQIDECLRKAKAYDKNMDWPDWLRVMTACLQTNGNATASDIVKALLDCVWA